MNEILHRGKSNDGEWVYGWYTMFPFGNLANELVIIPAGEPTGSPVEIDPQTAGMYTGIPDKNHVKIFEGDIVKAHGIIGEIIYLHGAFGIEPIVDIDFPALEEKMPHINNATFCHCENFISLWELWWNCGECEEDMLEVIGNVHDNPELLMDWHPEPQEK